MARKPKANGSVSVTRRTNGIDPFNDQTTNKRTKSSTGNTHLSLSMELKPMNEPQRQMIEAYCQGVNIAAVGSAGVGKCIGYDEIVELMVDQKVLETLIKAGVEFEMLE